MKKRLLLAAITAALASPIAVQAEAIMYGKIRVATQNASSNVPVGKSWGMEDHSSRLGVKGSEDLGGGISAVYQLEFGTAVGSGIPGNGRLDNNATNANASFWSQRESFVGLSGAFGTFLMGRHDTPFKDSTSPLDLFEDTQMDMDTGFGDPYAFGATGANARGLGLFDSLRASGVIGYKSPSFMGLTFMGALIQTRASRSFAGIAADVNGDGIIDGNGDATDPAAGYSLAAWYKNGPWFAAAGYENVSAESAVGLNETPDYNKWRIGFGIRNFQNLSASFIYEDRKIEGNRWNPNWTTSSWQLQAGYQYLPGMHVMVMYGEFLGDIAYGGGAVDNLGINTGGTARNFNTWGFGLKYDLSKRTDVQILYRVKDVDSVGPAGRDTAAGVDHDVYSIQLDHSF